MDKVQDVRKSSLTFAPEAGSQRMRNVINKGLTEEDILNGAGLAFEGGWNKVKLYFMLGLPGDRFCESGCVGIDFLVCGIFCMPIGKAHLCFLYAFYLLKVMFCSPKTTAGKIDVLYHCSIFCVSNAGTKIHINYIFTMKE
jgi:hypothetical protein